jgi:hypothetical protein
VERFALFVLCDFNIVAERVVELFLHVHDGGGFQVGEFNAFAEFFERGGLIFAIQRAFDVVDDFGGEIDVAGVFGENCFQKFKDIAFGQTFALFHFETGPHIGPEFATGGKSFFENFF